MNVWTAVAAASVLAFALALGCEENNPPPAAPPASADACGNQPNMAAALAYLREARQYLDRAEHNKGGWRDAAIRSTETAMYETARGCEFANAR